MCLTGIFNSLKENNLVLYRFLYGLSGCGLPKLQPGCFNEAFLPLESTTQHQQPSWMGAEDKAHFSLSVALCDGKDTLHSEWGFFFETHPSIDARSSPRRQVIKKMYFESSVLGTEHQCQQMKGRGAEGTVMGTPG